MAGRLKSKLIWLLKEDQGSPVYRAPIMVKETELTIKAYAGGAGKKDSAIVTGIFRIRQAAD
jgi:hypothetical protein